MDLTLQTTWLPTLMLAAARMLGLFLVAPVFGHSAVPVRLRYFLAAVAALAVVGAGGRFAEPVVLPAGAFAAGVAFAGELALGALIGYAVRLIFVGVELGAIHAAAQMGLTMAELFNPQGADEEGGVIRRLFVLTAVVVFLAVGGHRQVLAGLVGTFDRVPLMSFMPGSAALEMATGLLAATFVLALKVAAPVLVAMLLATVALGVLQRTVPQCNVLSIGLPVRALLGLAALALALAALPELLESAWDWTARALPAGLTGTP